MNKKLTSYLEQTKEAFLNLSKLEEVILHTSKLLIRALEEGNKILIFGNGGSASDAQHLAAEFVGRFESKRKPLAAIALNTDTSIITALSNDFGYDEIFSIQIDALGKKGDVAIGISTSGKSKSILKGLKKAKQGQLTTVFLTSKLYTDNKDYIDHLIKVDAERTGVIQQLHITIGQAMCLVVDEYYSDEENN